jgi:hypothetical protein
MSLKLNSSGGGSVTLQEPTTASNVTLNLPAADGTVVYENASGNVGIGTSSPSSFSSRTLQVTGSSTDVAVKLTNSTTGSGNSSGFDFELNGNDINYVNRTASGVQKFWTNSTERASIDSSGNFYVKNMAVGGTANLHWSSPSGQFFVTSSSRRFKHDIVDYDKGLAEVLQMQPKYFIYNQEPSQKQRVGFIAEDFHDLGMTEFVEYWKDENDQDTPSEIGYSNMVAICVKAIQEQQVMIEELKAKVAALEAQ